MTIRQPAPLPMLRLDQLGTSRGTNDHIKRSIQGMSPELVAGIKQLDLARVRPSELNPIAVRLLDEGKLTEDVVINVLLFRSPSARTLADDRPFDLIKEAEDIARVVRAASPMSRAASQRAGYEAAVYSAKGLATLIRALQAGVLFDAHA